MSEDQSPENYLKTQYNSLPEPDKRLIKMYVQLPYDDLIKRIINLPNQQ